MDSKLPFADRTPEEQAAAVEAMEEQYLEALAVVAGPDIEYDSPAWAVVQNLYRAWRAARLLHVSRVRAAGN